MDPSLVDVLVIGAGPAGLSAALGLARVCRSVRVFDSQQYRNDGVLAMNNVLCHDGESPALFRAKAMGDIMAKYPHVEFIDSEVTNVTLMAESSPTSCFRVTNKRGQSWVGKKILFATGSVDIIPSTPGFHELWGQDIYHCLFCDGYERRGQAIGILGASEMDLDHTLMTFAFKPTSITVFTDGAELNESSMGNELRDACARGCVIDQRIIRRFSRAPVGEGLQLHFDDGTSQALGFLIYHPRSISRAQHLFDQLGIEPFSMQSSFPQPQLPFGQLSVPGAFMAGDVATPFKIVSISAASG
ncbi:hypothetical protein BFJ70_g16059 [Fusarium oxysporum]|nr:hypothetical protein BFJ70_g16059 [Fusarium oxysporum]